MKFLRISSLRVKLRSFQLFYLSRPALNDDRSVSQCIDCVLQLHETEPLENGFLVFLPGADEITTACRIMQERQKESGLKMYVMPLYSALPTAKQNTIYNVYGVSS